MKKSNKDISIQEEVEVIEETIEDIIMMEAVTEETPREEEVEEMEIKINNTKRKILEDPNTKRKIQEVKEDHMVKEQENQETMIEIIKELIKEMNLKKSKFKLQKSLIWNFLNYLRRIMKDSKPQRN